MIDGGRYDGALGIVTAIAAVKGLKKEGKLRQFPRPIEVRELLNIKFYCCCIHVMSCTNLLRESSV